MGFVVSGASAWVSSYPGHQRGFRRIGALLTGASAEFRRVRLLPGLWVRAGQGLKISATAETETPSSRPSKPRCSVVVALTDTRSVSIPIAPAIAARMASM